MQPVLKIFGDKERDDNAMAPLVRFWERDKRLLFLNFYVGFEFQFVWFHILKVHVFTRTLNPVSLIFHFLQIVEKKFAGSGIMIMDDREVHLQLELPQGPQKSNPYLLVGLK